VTIDPDGNMGVGTNYPYTRLTVSGDATVEGNATIYGDTHVTGAVLVPESGDLAMGEFTSGPQP